MTTHPIVIVVDGVIASGKSTYIGMLLKTLTQRGWRVTVVKEPVDKWQESGALKRFYSDPKRWGYTFQTTAFHDRVMENVEAFEKYGARSDVFILERSPFTDTLFVEMLHESGTIDDYEFAEYKKWWKMWYRLMPYEPDMFIYLRPDLPEAMQRLKERARDGEQTVSMEYQMALSAKHDLFFASNAVAIGDSHFIPCFRLATNENFRDDETVQHKLTLHFEDLVNSIRTAKNREK